MRSTKLPIPKVDVETGVDGIALEVNGIREKSLLLKRFFTGSSDIPANFSISFRASVPIFLHCF